MLFDRAHLKARGVPRTPGHEDPLSRRSASCQKRCAEYTGQHEAQRPGKSPGSCPPCNAFSRKPHTSVVDVQWVAEPPLPASITCLSLSSAERFRRRLQEAPCYGFFGDQPYAF